MKTANDVLRYLQGRRRTAKLDLKNSPDFEYCKLSGLDPVFSKTSTEAVIRELNITIAQIQRSIRRANRR